MKAVFWCIKDTDKENFVFCVALEVGEIPRTDTKMSLFSQNSHDPCINLWQDFVVVFFDYILGAFPFSTVNPVTSTGRPPSFFLMANMAAGHHLGAPGKCIN